MITLENATQLLDGKFDTLSRDYHVKNLSIFGSVARGESSGRSDVDILVEFEGPADFMGFMNLKFYLEKLLGAPVDLVTKKALRPALKSAIECEAVRVA